MIQVCRHIMPDGARCKSPALANQPYCYHHGRLHRVVGSRKPDKKNSLTLRPLEDRRSVLMALSDVICGLAAGQIEPTTAGRLIYGLQVASHVATDFPWSVSAESVESVDFTQTGDEMAPELTLCTREDHCGSCPDAADCELAKAARWRAECADDEEADDDADEDDAGEKESADDRRAA